MWVEFVVGSRPCSEGFSPGTLVFLPPQKPTFPNSNLTWKQWMTSHSVDVPLIITIYLFYLFHAMTYMWERFLQQPVWLWRTELPAEDFEQGESYRSLPSDYDAHRYWV